MIDENKHMSWVTLPPEHADGIETWIDEKTGQFQMAIKIDALRDLTMRCAGLLKAIDAKLAETGGQ